MCYFLQVPAVQLTVDALGAVQSLLDLAESSDYDSFVPSIYCHLIFNFYIWRRADYNVQSGTVYTGIFNADSYLVRLKPNVFLETAPIESVHSFPLAWLGEYSDFSLLDLLYSGCSIRVS